MRATRDRQDNTGNVAVASCLLYKYSMSILKWRKKMRVMTQSRAKPRLSKYGVYLHMFVYNSNNIVIDF